MISIELMSFSQHRELKKQKQKKKTIKPNYCKSEAMWSDTHIPVLINEKTTSHKVGKTLKPA